MDVPAEILQGMVDYVAETNPLLEKAASVDTEVAQRAPAVVDSLIKAGLLDANLRQQTIEKVQDPLKVLESLRKVADLYAEQNSRPTALGAAADSRMTTTGSNLAPMKEADRMFLSRLGF